MPLLATPTLETERLALRKWELSDLDGLAQMCADPIVMEYFPALMDRVDSERMLVRLMEKQERNGSCFPVIADKVDGTFIGFAGLSIPEFDVPLPFDPCVEIGWRIKSEYWGRGYATEASRAWLAYGFETLGLEEIIAMRVPMNIRSGRVMDKLGMHRDAVDDFDHPAVDDDSPLKRHVLHRLRLEEFMTLSK
ncbi:N-acetyltransferase [Rhodobacteraceae bacterium RKSG542]|uniref:GNAT family N-acetyltransferase n=1 Tax=Pseudovibrio flavus TaxID=2529854 RepID=UPI0012BC43F5|nr:GNAT family N-acetyltransferase [Pseudovibrio flavus]MTI18474.1 N-acetyltransferase [Pseudovibrio flavus]